MDIAAHGGYNLGWQRRMWGKAVSLMWDETVSAKSSQVVTQRVSMTAHGLAAARSTVLHSLYLLVL
jgi:hypothetical protein